MENIVLSENVKRNNKDCCSVLNKVIRSITIIRESSETENAGNKIIFDDSEYRLCLKGSKDIICLFNKIYAVKDESCANRYVVLFVVHSGYNTDYVVHALFLYFDPDNPTVLVEKNFKPDVVCMFDSRDAWMTGQTTVLYKQTLAFFYTHRDTHKLVLHLNLLRYEDDFFIEQTTVWTHLNGNFEIQPATPRFLYDPAKKLVVDLGSLRLENTNKMCITAYSNITPVQLNEQKEEEFRSKYPDYCVKCCKLTSIASYGYDYTHIDMGQSYCESCQIRYSSSDNVWKCCQLLEMEPYLCGNSISSDLVCERKHNSSMCVVQTLRSNYYKPPYKKRLRLTAAPI